VLDNFPDHMTYLKDVGAQRLQTTYKMDIDVEFKFPWEEDGAPKTLPTDYEQDLETEGLVDTDGDEKIPSFFTRNWFVRGEDGLKFRLIEPFSRISNIWSVIVLLTFCYNLWYVPISIAFEY
jgi:hypothetical protein